MRHLRHRIKSSLWDYHKNRTEKECDAIESFITLDPTMMQYAWNRMKLWYKDTRKISPPPARLTMESITMERLDIYRWVSYPGNNIPVVVEHFGV